MVSLSVGRRRALVRLSGAGQAGSSRAVVGVRGRRGDRSAGSLPAELGTSGDGASSRTHPVRTRQTAGTRTAIRRGTSRWCLMRATSAGQARRPERPRRRRQPRRPGSTGTTPATTAPQRHDGQELPRGFRRRRRRRAAAAPAASEREDRDAPEEGGCARPVTSCRTTQSRPGPPARPARRRARCRTAPPRRRTAVSRTPAGPGAPRAAAVPGARRAPGACREHGHQEQEQHRSGADRQRRAVVRPGREGPARPSRPRRRGTTYPCCQPSTATGREHLPSRRAVQPGLVFSGITSSVSSLRSSTCTVRCSASQRAVATATRSPRSVSPGEPTRSEGDRVDAPGSRCSGPSSRCSPPADADGRERCRRTPAPAGCRDCRRPRRSSAPQSASPRRRPAPRGRRRTGQQSTGVAVGVDAGLGRRPRAR